MEVEGMTTEQVEAAHWAARTVEQHLSGIKLVEGLKVGESLLVGRHWAMNAAKVNEPKGRAYAEQFSHWKLMFKFPTDKEAEVYYDRALVCAANRPLADTIMAGLTARKKADMGVFGLARHIRKRLREEERKKEEELDPSPATKERAARATEETRLRAETTELRTAIVKMRDNPFSWWSGAATDGARAMFEDRGDGRRSDGRGREMCAALAREFRARFPSGAAALLDELVLILRDKP
jgi:hypothetical protein